jgi:hypothetical protein
MPLHPFVLAAVHFILKHLSATYYVFIQYIASFFCSYAYNIIPPLVSHSWFFPACINLLRMFCSVRNNSDEYRISNWHFLTTKYNSCEWPTWRTIPFSCMFIPNLYMFRALMCSSSGELIVSLRHLVYVTLCRWHIPDVVLIQLILLMMSIWVLETCRDLK